MVLPRQQHAEPLTVVGGRVRVHVLATHLVGCEATRNMPTKKQPSIAEAIRKNQSAGKTTESSEQNRMDTGEAATSGRRSREEAGLMTKSPTQKKVIVSSEVVEVADQTPADRQPVQTD